MVETVEPPENPEGEADPRRHPESSETRKTLKLLGEELAPDLEVLRHLGTGSAAEVFLARQKALNRLVAVKVLSKELAGESVARARFEREAKAAAALDHPNAVSVHRFGYLSDGVPYLVMHYVRGGTLEEKLAAEGPLPVDEARRVLASIAGALAAAHDRGFVHRDVRPANVLCDKEAERVLVSDFGLAGILPEAGSTDPRITRTGEILGLPPYLSPEQLRGEDPSEGTDVYALGILGYQILTGEGPYRGSSDRDLLVAHLRSPPRPLTSLRADVDVELADLLERCLAKEPGKRPSAAFLARALRGEAQSGKEGTGGVGHGSVVSSLLQRRLPQIVIVTGGVGFALLSFVQQMEEMGVLPTTSYKHGLNTYACGLATAGVIAWFHGRRGRQEVSALEVVILTAVFVVWIAVGAFIAFG